jgi:hypothetical protein
MATERIRDLVNISDRAINVHLDSGAVVSLPPQSQIQNVRVTNLDEIRPSVIAEIDLREVSPPAATRSYLRS